MLYTIYDMYMYIYNVYTYSMYIYIYTMYVYIHTYTYIYILVSGLNHPEKYESRFGILLLIYGKIKNV